MPKTNERVTMFGSSTKAIVTAAVYLVGVVLMGLLSGEWNQDELYVAIMGLVNVVAVYAFANPPA